MNFGKYILLCSRFSIKIQNDFSLCVFRLAPLAFSDPWYFVPFPLKKYFKTLKIFFNVPTQQQQSGIHPWTKVSLRILQDLALYTKRPWRSLNQSRVGKRHKDLNLSCEPCSGPQTTVLGLLGSGITITCWQSETISHRQVRLYLSLGLLRRSFSIPMEQKNESLDTLERVNETAWFYSHQSSPKVA